MVPELAEKFPSPEGLATDPFPQHIAGGRHYTNIQKTFQTVTAEDSCRQIERKSASGQYLLRQYCSSASLEHCALGTYLKTERLFAKSMTTTNQDLNVLKSEEVTFTPKRILLTRYTPHVFQRLPIDLDLVLRTREGRSFNPYALQCQGQECGPFMSI